MTQKRLKALPKALAQNDEIGIKNNWAMTKILA